MAHNILITGPPRIGKTTVFQRVTDRLTDERSTLAHVDRTDGPKVGRYRVNVDNVDTMYTAAFQRAFEDADIVIVDEIAPMQTYSEAFPDQVRRILSAELPVLATIKAESTDGIIGEVKQRDDIER